MNLRRTTDRKIQSTFSSGFLLALLLLAGCGRQQVIPIFLWHSVGEGQPGDKYDLTPEEFEGQLKMLQERGIQTVTLDQYFDHLDGRSSLPEKAVVLSFDDGRKCQHSVVMPLLLKYGLVAETFLVNSYLGESNETRVVRNDAGRTQTYLIWPEVREMAASGAFIIEATTDRNRGFSLSRAMLRADPVDRSSITVTVSPRSSNASARWEPRNPAPPVMKTRLRRL